MQLGFLMQSWMWFFTLKPAPGYNSSPSKNTPRTESKGVRLASLRTSCNVSITHIAKNDSLKIMKIKPTCCREYTGYATA